MGCTSYFPTAVIKHHLQRQLKEEEVYLAYGFREINIHIRERRIIPRSMNGKRNILEALQRAPPSRKEVCKYLSLWWTFLSQRK